MKLVHIHIRHRKIILFDDISFLRRIKYSFSYISTHFVIKYIYFYCFNQISHHNFLITLIIYVSVIIVMPIIPIIINLIRYPHYQYHLDYLIRPFVPNIHSHLSQIYLPFVMAYNPPLSDHLGLI